MNSPSTINLQTGASDYDLSSDEIGDALEITSSWKFSITPNFSGVTGNPTYTLQVSNDNVTWFDYNNNSTVIAIDDGICDVYMSFVYLRVNTTSNGATGTGNFILKFRK